MVQFLHYTCVLQPVDQTILLPNRLWLKWLRTKRLTRDSIFGLENWNKILASTKIFTHFFAWENTKRVYICLVMVLFCK